MFLQQAPNCMNLCSRSISLLLIILINLKETAKNMELFALISPNPGFSSYLSCLEFWLWGCVLQLFFTYFENSGQYTFLSTTFQFQTILYLNKQICFYVFFKQITPKHISHIIRVVSMVPHVLVSPVSCQIRPLCPIPFPH